MDPSRGYGGGTRSLVANIPPQFRLPSRFLAIARNHGQWVGCHCQQVLRATASLRACMNFKLAEYGLDFDDSIMNR